MLLIGVIGCGVTNIIIAFFYLFGVSEVAVLAAIVLDYIFFNMGPEPIVFMVFSELFPEKYKFKLNAIGYAINWISCIISVFIFNLFLNGTEYIVYFLFASLTLFFGISGTLLCPETHNK